MTHTIDVSKGQCIGTVSAQWATRPDDQKFLNLSDLRAKVSQWADHSRVSEVLPAEITAEYDAEDESALRIHCAGTEISATHWGFEQACRVARVPANYMRSLPGPLAALNINYGLRTAEQNPVAAYIHDDPAGSCLRGITSPRYGRIYDWEVVDAVRKIAGDGTGDTRWKVPGCIEWGNAHGVSYNPEVDITKENTTLYASDRDVFLFLVDDRNPIEVGKLANGDPDLMFRGFYVWNSEVGARTFGVASMYLRGVCQNRNLWGVEGFKEVTFKHTALAPDRFVTEVAPLLMSFSDGATDKVTKGVEAAKKAIVAKTDDDRLEFLGRYGFTQKAAQSVITTCEAEEGYLPTAVWDFAQAITAIARREQFQENRLKLEAVAGKLLDKVKA